eukprot:215767-Pelagomonas_calceolata.AAC.1
MALIRHDATKVIDDPPFLADLASQFDSDAIEKAGPHSYCLTAKPRVTLQHTAWGITMLACNKY